MCSLIINVLIEWKSSGNQVENTKSSGKNEALLQFLVKNPAEIRKISQIEWKTLDYHLILKKIECNRNWNYKKNLVLVFAVLLGVDVVTLISF